MKDETAAKIMAETDRRVLAGDILHTKKRIAELDAQIAKLQAQRDKQMQYLSEQQAKGKLTP